MQVAEGRSSSSERLREVASGIDALYLSGRGILGSGLLERLAADKDLAVEVGQQVRFDVGGVEWQLSPKGWGMYRYSLTHPFGQLGFSPNHGIPEVRVQPRAEFLHGEGPEGAVEWFRDMLALEGVNVVWTVSRLDIHADFQGWVLSGDDRHRFVSRSREITTREVDGEFTGFEFGKRKSKTVLCRIYDKTAELEHSGAAYWRDIWENFDPDESVVRIEFELGRTFLKQAGVGTPESTFARLPHLWAYCANDWLTYRTPSADGTKSRWPIDAAWAVVQSARIGTGGHGVERVYAGKAAGELEKLMPGVVGYLSSVAALMGLDTADQVGDWFPLLSMAYEDRTGTRFVDRVIEKRIGIGLP